ncbi:MAG TPA: hypothetical protein DIW54_09325 [Chitinophagaceae bacterium]|nr:hypothetical protein [Chitinophagaceae bacterium]
MILYATHISERLRYIVQTLFGDACVITDSVTVYQQTLGFHINYSDEIFAIDGCRIQPHGLLNEKGIRAQNIHLAQWMHLPIFFPTAGQIPFDIFAAAFYLISRYEEYLPFEADTLGRFPHTASLASRAGFLHRPLINEWLLQWKKLFPELQLRQTAFQFQPTYDVDIAYAYKGKPFWIQLVNICRSLISADWDAVSTQWLVWKGKHQDPFDQYDWFSSLHHPQWQPLYFLLAAKHRSELDKQVDRNTQADYLQDIDANQVGLHASSQAFHAADIWREEVQFLSTQLNRPIQKNRQHYLLLSLPQTYQKLIDLGIDEDYSMGYSTANGFRASYAQPFYWYDLSKEQITSLKLFPFVCMDSTCIFQLQLSPVETLQEYYSYLQKVQQVQGFFASVIHPHLCINSPFFEGYRQAYAKLLQRATKTS